MGDAGAGLRQYALQPARSDQRTNAGQLQVAWMFSVGTQHGQEAAPLVVGDTLYVVSSYPNKVFALDATTGDLKWTYIPRESRCSGRRLLRRRHARHRL